MLWDMTDIRQGDCRELLRAMDAGSVQCAVTSPPYWGLREYDVGEENRPVMIGLESTLDDWLSAMVETFRELRRVLRDDGCIFVNCGDAFNDKQLLGMPWRLAFALQANGWHLRSEIIWAKPNPMPESVTDRPTKSHEQIFLLSKRPRYFYDAEAVKQHNTPGSIRRFGLASGQQSRAWNTDNNKRDGRTDGTRSNEAFRDYVPSSANLRDVWTMPTQSYSEAHFATFPVALPARCIMAGTSDKGCCPHAVNRGGGW